MEGINPLLFLHRPLIRHFFRRLADYVGLKRLRFNIDADSLGITGLDIALDAMNGGMHLLGANAWFEAHPQVYQQIVWAHVHSEYLGDTRDCRIGFHALADIGQCVGINTLA
jgi:hypothetical protein